MPVEAEARDTKPCPRLLPIPPSASPTSLLLLLLLLLSSEQTHLRTSQLLFPPTPQLSQLFPPPRICCPLAVALRCCFRGATLHSNRDGGGPAVHHVGPDPSAFFLPPLRFYNLVLITVLVTASRACNHWCSLVEPMRFEGTLGLNADLILSCRIRFSVFVRCVRMDCVKSVPVVEGVTS